MSAHAGPPVVCASALSKRFGSLAALDGLDLDIRGGELTALLGQNGAGKTTAIRLILGLGHPDAGSLSVFGAAPGSACARIRTGAMLQATALPDTLSVTEHIALFSSYYPAPLPLEQVAAAAGVTDILDRHYGRLSGGQQRRVEFALALVGDPDLIVLDEPTAGLDIDSRHAFWRTVRARVAAGSTVLLTTHHLEEAEALADRILVLHHGRIVADGTPGEIKAGIGGKRIRFRPGDDARNFADLPGVRSSRETGGYREIVSDKPEVCLRALLAADPAVADITVSGIGLEEAFLSLTGEDGTEIAA